MSARCAGFTLLEMLVALALFALIAAAAYSGLDSALAARAELERRAERLAELQMAFHFLQRDIEQIVPRSVRDEFGQRRPALQGGDGESLLVFTRAGWDNPLGQPRAGLQRLAYRWRDGQLLRVYWTSLDRGRFDPGLESVLLEGVAAAEVRFLDRSDRWQSRWPAAEAGAGRLPRALELRLVLRDWGEIVRLWRLVDA